MTEIQKGNIYIVSEMILWSLFPIVSLLGLKGVPSMVSLFWVNLFAMVFFLVVVISRGKISELKNKGAWYYTFGTVILINIIFYGLFFYALNKTNPANAAIVALFEIVPSYILFQIIKKENFSKRHMAGIICAFIGAMIVLLPKAGKVNPGDFIILFAVFFPPFGNWCQQQTRKLVSSESALFLRHFIALPFLFFLTFLFKTSIFDFNIMNVIWWLVLNGVLIFGASKILWLEAIHRMSVTKALAINSLNPILTVFFSWLIIKQLPTMVQIFSLPFMIIAIFLLTNFNFWRKDKLEA